LGVGCRQAHGHVDVGAAGGQGGGEDRVVEAGVAGVHDHVGVVGAGDGHDVGGAGGVDAGGGKADAIVEAADHGFGSLEGDVGQDEPVEERAPLGNGRDRRPDAACADYEDVHDSGPPVALLT